MPYVARIRGPLDGRPGLLARCRDPDHARRDPRARGALHRGDGRTAGEGPRVLPEQLRRLADEARARLRAALRRRLRRRWCSRLRRRCLPLVFVAVVLWSLLAAGSSCSCWHAGGDAGGGAAADPPRARRWWTSAKPHRTRWPATSPTRSRTRKSCARSRGSPTKRASMRATCGDYGAKTLRSWDYQNLRIDMITSPMFVATNILGLIVALWRRAAAQARASKPCSSRSATTRPPRA